MTHSTYIRRNTLGPAHSCAEGLYDNAIALALFLDAWSRRERTPDLNPAAIEHLRHNLINAEANLDMLRQVLAPHLYPPETQPDTQPPDTATNERAIT